MSTKISINFLLHSCCKLLYRGLDVYIKSCIILRKFQTFLPFLFNSVPEIFAVNSILPAKANPRKRQTCSAQPPCALSVSANAGRKRRAGPSPLCIPTLPPFPSASAQRMCPTSSTAGPSRSARRRGGCESFFDWFYKS
jgi:hypothetical protein